MSDPLRGPPPIPSRQTRPGIAPVQSSFSSRRSVTPDAGSTTRMHPSPSTATARASSSGDSALPSRTEGLSSSLPEETSETLPAGTAALEIRRLSRELRAEIRVAVRSAIDEALGPALRVQQELVMRLEREMVARLERGEQSFRTTLERMERTARSTPAPAAPRGSSEPPWGSRPAALPIAALRNAPSAMADASWVSQAAVAPLGGSMGELPVRPPSTEEAFRELLRDSTLHGGELPSELDGSRRRRRMVWLLVVVIVLVLGAILFVTLRSQMS